MSIKPSTRTALGQILKIEKAADPAVSSFVRETADLQLTKAKALYAKRVVRNPRVARTGRLEGSFSLTVHGRNYDMSFGEGLEYAQWWDFGGHTGGRGGGERKVIKGGRTIFPAWRAIKKDAAKLAEKQLERLAHGVG